MDIILKLNFKNHIHFKDSISIRIILICSVAALLLVIFSNALIFTKMESSTLSTKQSELTAAASEYSASLSAYGLSHTPEVSNTRADIYRRIIVTDTELEIIYDSSDIDNIAEKKIFLPAVLRALRGEKYFSFESDNAIYESCASVAVISEGKIIGTVSVFETDESMMYIHSAIKSAIIIICIVAIVLFIICALSISSLLLRRISNLTESIRKNRSNEKNDQIAIEFNDEISPIIREFNDIYERLSYVQQMRQAFVSDASHELRTPLAAIRLLCESITQTDNVDAETAREFMEDIIFEVDRMSHTAEKLLVLSKLDNGNKSQFAPISLSETVHKMIIAFTPIANAKNVRIESHIEEDCSILGDMEGANQIIGNLIDNAIKYNNVNGMLKIYLFSKNGRCTFIVDDTGIGIAPEYRKHVFERFYRVDKSREHDGRGGSGLGLAIVKRNVESFGGTIEISDSVHGGTRFKVVFPSLLSYEEGFAR